MYSKLYQHNNPAWCIDVAADKKTFATGFQDRKILVIRDNNIIFEILDHNRFYRMPKDKPAEPISIAAVEKMAEDSLQTFDFANLALTTPKVPTRPKDPLASPVAAHVAAKAEKIITYPPIYLKFSPSGKYLLSVSFQGLIVITNMETRTNCFAHLVGGDEFLNAYGEFSADEKYFIVACSNTRAHIFNLKTRQCVKTIESEYYTLNGIGFYQVQKAIIAYLYSNEDVFGLMAYEDVTATYLAPLKSMEHPSNAICTRTHKNSFYVLTYEEKPPTITVKCFTLVANHSKKEVESSSTPPMKRAHKNSVSDECKKYVIKIHSCNVITFRVHQDTDTLYLLVQLLGCPHPSIYITNPAKKTQVIQAPENCIDFALLETGIVCITKADHRPGECFHLPYPQVSALDE